MKKLILLIVLSAFYLSSCNFTEKQVNKGNENTNVENGDSNESASVDSDSDGLPDALENIIGTDSDNPDTDGDGLSDGAEVLTHRTNPLVTDTDGDGILDGVEIDLGSNPLDRSNESTTGNGDDPDNDGLSSGTERFLGTDPNKFDTDGDGLSDGVEVKTHLTRPLVVDTDGDGVSDGNEINNGTNPLDPNNGGLDPLDSDNDGIVDQVEVVIGTDPNKSDTDSDGLSDGAEIKTHQTSPLLADTDGGGVKDGQEIDLGTNPLNSSDDRLPDPPTLVFLTTPTSETTETDADFVFTLRNFDEPVKSVECFIDNQSTSCQPDQTVRLSNLALGTHAFVVNVTDNDDLVRSFSFQWLIKAPVPVDVCQDGVRTKETIQFSFPQTTTVCEFGVGINLGKKNSFTQAVRTQSQKMILPDGAKICELKVNFPKQSYKYDDDMALTWNGLTLLTNRVQMLNSNKEFNFLNIRGQQFTDHTPFCFGQESGSQCTLPQTDRSGDIELKLSETAIQELITRFGEEPQHDVSVHVTGDNDNSDCQHKGFGFTVEVTYGE